MSDYPGDWLMRNSVREWLDTAPNPQTLREMWQLLRDRRALRDASPDTVRRWEEVVCAKAYEYMDRDPEEALFAYNTLFTILDSKTNDCLLGYALTRQKYAFRTQRSAAEV